ncbi:MULTISPECIES: CAP domain-containing protein [unclassified Sphingomonas]|nr:MULTISPECIES: CAP domain-containing protein [unclassified Sphingomonas]
MLGATLTANTAPLEPLQLRTLAIHNEQRAMLGIAGLRWDPKLAEDAAIWAKHLAALGHLEHSPDDLGDPDPEGENLWAGTAGSFSIEQMSTYWADEKRYYKNGIFPNNSTTGDLDDVGHYTQMVWRSTTRVGCATIRGAKDDFFVCRYGEGGNVLGERPY